MKYSLFVALEKRYEHKSRKANRLKALCMMQKNTGNKQTMRQ